MLRIAIQAKGRLNEKSSQLLIDADIEVKNPKRKLLVCAENFPAEILYLRDDDIPTAVAQGVADIGIVGMNEVTEKGVTVNIEKDLGFGKCRISLAIPKDHEYTGINYFEGKQIATSYPRILKNYFEEQGVKAKIIEIAGSVEIAPAAGMADAIFDIVSSGGTLISNGLKEVESVMTSSAVLISNPELSDEKKEIVSQLLFRFESILRSVGQKYVLFNIPDDKIELAIKVLPSLKSPTLLPLAQKGWSSIHTVISEDKLWTIINELKSMGAEDILVLSLDKIIP
ncbi:MAG: ATP phosphoribosyltransferase [Bacteroidales bacterium]